VMGLYLVGVAVYSVALGFATFRTRAVEKHVADLGGSYTNALELKARYQVLKDRQELKFAALECWNLTARFLPESATLDVMSFVDGKKLALNGSAPSGQQKELYDFENELRKATASNGEGMFDSTKGEHLNYQVDRAGGSVKWNFSLELKRVEVE